LKIAGRKIRVTPSNRSNKSKIGKINERKTSPIDKNKILNPVNEYSNWFDINYSEDKNNIIVNLNNGEEEVTIKAKKKLEDKTTNKYTFIIDDSTNLAFDHALIILTGLMRLKNKIKDTDIAFNLVPKYFTLGELQQVYEIILGKKLIHSVFRRIIADRVKIVDKKVKTGGHRPSNLFKYVGKVDERYESK
jgi:hypothetical protein